MERSRARGIAGLGTICFEAAPDDSRDVLRACQRTLDRGGFLRSARAIPRGQVEQPMSRFRLLRPGGSNDGTNELRIEIRPDRQPMLMVPGREATLGCVEFQGDLAGFERVAV